MLDDSAYSCISTSNGLCSWPLQLQSPAQNTELVHQSREARANWSSSRVQYNQCLHLSKGTENDQTAADGRQFDSITHSRQGECGCGSASPPAVALDVSPVGEARLLQYTPRQILVRLASMP